MLEHNKKMNAHLEQGPAYNKRIKRLLLLCFSTPSSSLVEVRGGRGRASEIAYIKARESLAAPPEAMMIKLLPGTESSKNRAHMWNKFIKELLTHKSCCRYCLTNGRLGTSR